MEGIKDALVGAMREYFGDDARRIQHALDVTAFAERIMAREGGDYPVVVAAGVLHDIGIHEAERKYGSTAGMFQETEGPPIAREILARLGFDEGRTEETCGIIAHHHSPGKINTLNFKVLYDADWLVNLRDEYDIRDRRKLAAIIDAVFLTATGRALAREIFLEGRPDGPGAG
jgi:HD superfamily phosphodiesterase